MSDGDGRFVEPATVRAMGFTVRATIAQTPTPAELTVLEDQLVTVGGDGVIESVEPARGSQADVVVADDTWLLPGLIDTHVHAPQWPQLGTGLDLPLDQWLFQYTFPLEARYVDVGFARRVWAAMVPTLLANGTTTAVYYGSIHEPATVALAEACIKHGQRAFVGRVAMDHSEGTPEWYRDSDAVSGIEASARSVSAIQALAGPEGLVQPIITPRFIPACTDELLTGLGNLADQTGALTQTHCSENDWEHAYVLDRHGCTDSESLANFGLVRDHTVLAHATMLANSDRELLVAKGAGVSHCPLSNVYFGDAVFAVREALAAGLRVGLGTDIAGGPDPSMLAQAAHAVTASRQLEHGVDAREPAERRGRPDSRIDAVTAFWLATVGGADLLGIPAGLLGPGRAFDAIAVSTARLGTWPEVDDNARIFEKLIRGARAGAITSVWVNGRAVV